MIKTVVVKKWVREIGDNSVVIGEKDANNAVSMSTY